MSRSLTGKQLVQGDVQHVHSTQMTLEVLGELLSIRNWKVGDKR